MIKKVEKLKQYKSTKWKQNEKETEVNIWSFRAFFF